MDQCGCMSVSKAWTDGNSLPSMGMGQFSKLIWLIYSAIAKSTEKKKKLPPPWICGGHTLMYQKHI